MDIAEHNEPYSCTLNTLSSEFLERCFILLHSALIKLVKMVRNVCCDWLKIIKEFCLKRWPFNQSVFLGRVFYAFNFLISTWTSIKVDTNPQKVRFYLLTKYVCFTQHGFENMMHFMAKWSHCYNLPAVFLNVVTTPKMLRNSFLVRLSVILSKEMRNFTARMT